MFLKDKKTIAMHISGESIRILIGKKKGQGFQVENKGHFLLGSNELIDFLKVGNIGKYKSQLVIGGDSIFFSLLMLPPIPPEEIKKVISWEFRRFVPVPWERELVLDYRVIDEIKMHQEVKQRVLVIGALNQEIRHYQRFLRQLGIRLGCIDIEAMAIKNLCQSLNRPVPPKCCLYLESSRGVIIFLAGDRLLYLGNFRYVAKDLSTVVGEEFGKGLNYLKQRLFDLDIQEILMFTTLEDSICFQGLSKVLNLKITPIGTGELPGFGQLDKKYLLAFGLGLREVD